VSSELDGSKDAMAVFRARLKASATFGGSEQDITDLQTRHPFIKLFLLTNIAKYLDIARRTTCLRAEGTHNALTVWVLQLFRSLVRQCAPGLSQTCGNSRLSAGRVRKTQIEFRDFGVSIYAYITQQINKLTVF
jgi:hypothetical protein